MSVLLTMVDVMRPVLTVTAATHVSVTVDYDCYPIKNLVDVSEMKIRLYTVLSWHTICLQRHPGIALPVAMVAEHHVMPKITHAAMQAINSIGMECCVEVRTSFIWNIILIWTLANSTLKKCFSICS